MNLNNRQKSYVRQQRISHSAFLSGYVESVGSDDTLTIRIKGRDSTVTVFNNSGYNLSQGDSVTLCRFEGDSQKFSIAGFGAFGAGGQA